MLLSRKCLRIEWEPPLKGRLFDKIEWEPPLKGRLFDKIEWEPPLNSGFRLAPVARIEWEPPHSILAFSVFFITHRSFSVLRGGPHSIFSKRRPPENSEILRFFLAQEAILSGLAACLLNQAGNT